MSILSLIKVVGQPTSGSNNRVASYIEYNGMSDRASRLFVESSPPSMDWLEKVFKLIKETGSRGIVSGVLHEVRIECEDKIEILEDYPALVDLEKGKVYFDEGAAGECKSLAE